MYTMLRDFRKKKKPLLLEGTQVLPVCSSGKRKCQWSVGGETDKLKPKNWEKNLPSCHTIHHESLRDSVLCNNSFFFLAENKDQSLNAIYGNNRGLL